MAVQAIDERGTEVGRLIDERPFSALQIRVLVLCSLIVMLDGYDIQTMALAVPTIAAEWSFALGDFGIALSAAVLGMGVGSAFLAPLGDRFGRRPVILTGFAVVGLSSLATISAGDITHFAAWRFVTGLGLGVCQANATALTSEYMPARVRMSLVGLMFCCVAVGASAASFTAPLIIEHMGWRGIFIVGGVGPLALLAVLWFALPESVRILLVRRPDDRRIPGLMKQLAPDALTDRVYAADPEPVQRLPILELLAPTYRTRTLLLWCIFCLNLFVLYLLISWMPALLGEAGWERADALRGAGLIQTGGIVGGLTAAWFADRASPARALSGTYVVAALALASFLILPPDVSLWMTLIFLLGCGISGAQLVLYSLAATIYPPTMRATGIGWAGAISRVGAVSGPIAGAWIVAQGVSTPSVLGLLLVPTLLCAASALLLPRVLRG